MDGRDRIIDMTVRDGVVGTAKAERFVRNVAPTIDALGVPMETVAALYAGMTLQGVSAETAELLVVQGLAVLRGWREEERG